MNGQSQIVIDKAKYINNREFQGIIKKCIENIFNIDFSKNSKFELTNAQRASLANYKLYNLGNYFYYNNFSFKYTFLNKPVEYNLTSHINILYSKDDRTWILANLIILPIKLINI